MWGLRENVLLVGDDSSFMMVAEDEDPHTHLCSCATRKKPFYFSLFCTQQLCVCVLGIYNLKKTLVSLRLKSTGTRDLKTWLHTLLSDMHKNETQR